MLEELSKIVGKNYQSLSASQFSNLIIPLLRGKVKREVKVKNRGDGRPGKIDLVVYFRGKSTAIELDRLKPRIKSVFKLKEYGADESFIVLRSPVSVIKI